MVLQIVMMVIGMDGDAEAIGEIGDVEEASEKVQTKEAKVTKPLTKKPASIPATTVAKKSPVEDVE